MTEIVTIDNDIMPNLDSGLYLIDYYANFCGPCKMLAPILSEISNERSDITIVKINIEDNINLAKNAKIKSIPTLQFIKDGQLITTHVGAPGKTKLNEIIDNIISS